MRRHVSSDDSAIRFESNIQIDNSDSGHLMLPMAELARQLS